MTPYEFFKSYLNRIDTRNAELCKNGYFLKSYNENELMDILDVGTNEELCKQIYMLECSGFYVSVDVNLTETIYDIFKVKPRCRI